MRLSQEPRSFDVFFELQMRAERRQPVRPSFVFFLFGPFLRLKTPRIRWFPTDTLRKWNPRPACGTAIKSVRISMSVSTPVPKGATFLQDKQGDQGRLAWPDPTSSSHSSGYSRGTP